MRKETLRTYTTWLLSIENYLDSSKIVFSKENKALIKLVLFQRSAQTQALNLVHGNKCKLSAPSGSEFIFAQLCEDAKERMYAGDDTSAKIGAMEVC